MKKKPKKRTAKKSVITKDIWPQERDYMLRPERYRYVRKLLKIDGCVFCDANKKGVGQDAYNLFQDDDIMVLLNKYPYNTGHVMILPVEHQSDLTKLSDKVIHKMASMKQKLVEVLRTVYQPGGFNIGLNHGAVAGAGIESHLHWHVIPRWNGDTNFFPLIAETKVLPETLDETYRKLKEHF